MISPASASPQARGGGPGSRRSGASPSLTSQLDAAQGCVSRPAREGGQLVADEFVAPGLGAADPNVRLHDHRLRYTFDRGSSPRALAIGRWAPSRSTHWAEAARPRWNACCAFARNFRWATGRRGGRGQRVGLHAPAGRHGHTRTFTEGARGGAPDLESQEALGVLVSIVLPALVTEVEHPSSQWPPPA